MCGKNSEDRMNDASARVWVFDLIDVYLDKVWGSGDGFCGATHFFAWHATHKLKWRMKKKVDKIWECLVACTLHEHHYITLLSTLFLGRRCEKGHRIQRWGQVPQHLALVHFASRTEFHRVRMRSIKFQRGCMRVRVVWAHRARCAPRASFFIQFQLNSVAGTM